MMEIANDIPVNVTFKELSGWGLIYKINKEVLHPLGLSLTWHPMYKISLGANVAPDLVWEYPEEMAKRNEEKYQKFLEERETILKNILIQNSN